MVVEDLVEDSLFYCRGKLSLLMVLFLKHKNGLALNDLRAVNVSNSVVSAKSFSLKWFIIKLILCVHVVQKENAV